MNRPRPRPRAAAEGFAAVLDRVAVKLRSFQKLEVKRVVDAFAEELFDELRRAGRFHWPSRGVFRITHRKARKISNPATGAVMWIPASVGIGFRAALAEKERLHG